jgi:hypothetical protein
MNEDPRARARFPRQVGWTWQENEDILLLMQAIGTTEYSEVARRGMAALARELGLTWTGGRGDGATLETQVQEVAASHDARS